jgi:hypothetical protein
MKALALVACLFSLVVATAAQAQEVLPIGKIQKVDDKAPTTWAMSGMEMVKLTATVDGLTPITRSLYFDARTVEILSRTQAPPIRASDIKVVRTNGQYLIVARRYLLLEVRPEDARAEKTSVSALANQWAAAIRKVLPQVAPTPNRFGI